MNLRVLDRASEAGHPVNEDVCGATSSALWLIDGASPVDPQPFFAQDSDARWLSDIADREFSEVLQHKPTQSRLKTAVRAAARAAKSATDDRLRDTSGEVTLPSAAVTLVELVDSTLHYFALGDVSLALTLNNEVQTVENERGLEKERQHLVRMASAHPTGATTYRDKALFDQQRRVRRENMNRPDGYWILSTSPDAADHGRTGEFMVQPGARLLLASDGFARLVTTMSVYANWKLLLDDLPSRSLIDLIKTLRELEAGDPEGHAYPRISTHDDATAIYAEVVDDSDGVE